MKRKLPTAAVAITFLVTHTVGLASDHDEQELDEGQLFFELNDTDGDLGIHGKADGDAWRKMVIEGPEGDRIDHAAMLHS